MFLQSQRHIRDFIFDTVNDAENSGRLHEVCYVKETKTWYEYVSGCTLDIDHLKVLKTKKGGNHKWVAFAGFYSLALASINVTFQLNRQKVRNRWLHYNNIPSNINGYLVPHNGEVAGITVSLGNDCSGICRIKIKDNGNISTLYSIILSSQSSKILDHLHLPLLRGQQVGVYIESANGLISPSVTLYIRLRCF